MHVMEAEQKYRGKEIIYRRQLCKMRQIFYRAIEVIISNTRCYIT